MGTCKRFLEKQKKSDCLLRPLHILIRELFRMLSEQLKRISRIYM